MKAIYEKHFVCMLYGNVAAGVLVLTSVQEVMPESPKPWMVTFTGQLEL